MFTPAQQAASLAVARGNRYRYSSFETGWQPDSYLARYYSRVENDERATLQFLVRAAARLPETPLLLEFGCGPTVHHLFPFATRCREIHVADYLPANLQRVRRWIAAGPEAHDWAPFAEYTLRAELGRSPVATEVGVREQQLRRRIRRFLLADARRSRPILDREAPSTYPTVLSCFCPDSITDVFDEWRRCMLNIASLVAPDGWLVLAALRATDVYHVGNDRFPSAAITEDDVIDVLSDAGFAKAAMTIEVARAEDQNGYGFSEIILATCRRV